MASCKVCIKPIGNKAVKLECSDCNGEFHATCLKFSKADVDCITADGLTWRCNDCAAERRKSMRLESDSVEGKLTLEDIMKVVTEIRDTQKSCEKSFSDAYEFMNAQLEDNTKAIQFQTEQTEKLFQLIENVTTENKQLKNKVKLLENKIEEMEQYSRSNCVEIQGIPRTPEEDVLSVVKNVGKAIDMDIIDTMVDVCHRLGPVKAGKNPPGIIVKFVRRVDKEEFMKKRREKDSLSTRHIGRADDLPIFVNESLSPARRKLHGLAKAYKKENNYKFLWVRNGKIFLRETEDAPVKVISSQEDLK